MVSNEKNCGEEWLIMIHNGSWLRIVMAMELSCVTQTNRFLAEKITTQWRIVQRFRRLIMCEADGETRVPHFGKISIELYINEWV